MKKIVAIVIIALATGCSKSTSDSGIAGTWIFTKQTAFSYSVYQSAQSGYLLPVSISQRENTARTMQVSFNADGNFFCNRTLYSPTPDNGTYKIYNDSLLIIKPDSSAFKNFCLSVFTLSSSSTYTPPSSLPPVMRNYADTLIFKRQSDGTLNIQARVVTKVTPRTSGNPDSLVLNVINTSFVR